MLFMIVQTHNAESCAFRSESDGVAMVGSLDRLDEVAPRYDITVHNAWINRPGHEFFLIVDAPSAHAVDDALVETGLVGRTHSRVVSVLPADEVQVPAQAAHATATA